MTKKKVVVTGGAGHVGSHVIEELLRQGYDNIISLDNYSTGSEENHLEGVDYRRGHTVGIASLVPEEVEVVYHLGEYARIAPSFDDVTTVYVANALGTFSVAEFARSKGAKLVYAASSTKFATDGQERHQNPYSFTKANNVDLINNYGKWFDLNYAICYFYNAYGPREGSKGTYATLIGKFQQAYLNNQPLTVVKPGTQRRNFTYVGDIARGMVLVGEKGSGDGYSLGNLQDYSVLEIAEAFGGEVELIDGYPGRAESGQIGSRARDELGWETTVNILDYIREFKDEQTRTN